MPNTEILKKGLKKKEFKVEVDTSTAKEFQAKIKEKQDLKLSSLADKFNISHSVTVGTRKGINSILKKAGNRHKVAEAKAIKIAEEKKLDREKHPEKYRKKKRFNNKKKKGK